jgi:hypothetical protein
MQPRRPPVPNRRATRAPAPPRILRPMRAAPPMRRTLPPKRGGR